MLQDLPLEMMDIFCASVQGRPIQKPVKILLYKILALWLHYLLKLMRIYESSHTTKLYYIYRF